jgi:pyruvate ferredoxin oxidoreductase beta subunit
MHSAFENAAATASGIETMYRALRKKGKISKDVKFIAFGGDGGTYDIGFQALSGAMERGHQLLYICYDNGAYMNTGIQRSSATPSARTYYKTRRKRCPGEDRIEEKSDKNHGGPRYSLCRTGVAKPLDGPDEESPEGP